MSTSSAYSLTSSSSGVTTHCIHGLDEVMAGELVEFEEGTIGIALNLESNNVGVVLMGDDLMIQEGSSVKATGRIAQIPVAERFIRAVEQSSSAKCNMSFFISCDAKNILEQAAESTLRHERGMP
ncbi:hypothetical protein BVRB_1g011690 [Beta vulgaris subsp. vulgaris]|nr:hypothetical protein BVRB_1g011690 [Beta vulgaris subsp. vulgaris]